MTEVLVTAEQMKKIDSHAIDTIGIPSMVLMERAALEVAEEIIANFSTHENILVVCGVGNNGGDGVAAARMLFLKDKNIKILLIGEEEKASEETKAQLNIAKRMKIPIVHKEQEIDWEEQEVIIDAIFGIGLNREVEGEAIEVIMKINQSKAKKVSIDIASGLSADFGEILGVAVKADYTVTFGWKKKGMEIVTGEEYSGKVSVKDIGYPKESFEYGINP